jgi:hypothetical protein
MLILDSLNGAQPLQPGPRIQLFQRLDDRMEHIAEDGGCKSFPIIRRSVEEPSFCGLSFWEPWRQDQWKPCATAVQNAFGGWEWSRHSNPRKSAKHSGLYAWLSAWPLRKDDTHTHIRDSAQLHFQFMHVKDMDFTSGPWFNEKGCRCTRWFCTFVRTLVQMKL